MSRKSKLQIELEQEPQASLLGAVCETDAPTIPLLAKKMSLSQEEIGRRIRKLRAILLDHHGSHRAFTEETQDKLVDLFMQAIPDSEEEMAAEMAAAGVDVKATAERVRVRFKREMSGFLHNLRFDLLDTSRTDLIAVLDAIKHGASTVAEVGEAIGVTDVLIVRARLKQLRGLALIISSELRTGDDLIEGAHHIYGRLFDLFHEVAPPKETPGQAFAGLMEYVLRRGLR